MDSLVGKSCKGFKFEGVDSPACWSDEMESYIGLVGEIKSVDADNTVKIRFPNLIYWWYPLDQVEEHLVETPKVFTPLEKLMQYMIQNQYYIGNGLLTEYNKLRKEEDNVYQR